ANRRARGRSHQADALRVKRQWTLPLRREQALRCELLLELLERDLERAHALQLHRAHDQLVLPARLIDRHVALHQNFLAVPQKLALARRFAAKEHATELRPSVLEREINVPGTLRA